MIKQNPSFEEGTNLRLITSSDAAGIESSEESELWPFKNSVMWSYFGDLFFVTLDTPEGTDIISINEAVSIVLLTIGGVSVKEWTQ